MKKLLAVLLVLCLFVGMMPMAFAEGEPVDEALAETENVGGTETNVSTEPESATPTADETPAEPVEDKKIDILLLLKRNTMGGIVGNIYTVPVYLFHRFRFDL